MRRPAARVIALDGTGRVLLIQGRDPADASKPAWWEIPGGGIDPGEASAHAAARELREEVGLRSFEVGPIVATQYVEFDFAGIHFESDEVIHVAFTDAPDDRGPRHLERLEELAFGEDRWWTVDEVVASTEPFLPPWLPELLPRLATGDLPSEPIDFTPSDEG